MAAHSKDGRRPLVSPNCKLARKKAPPVQCHGALPVDVCSWNAGGFWIWDDDSRALKQATVRDLSRKYHVIAIEEAHVEPEDLSLLRLWAREHKLLVFLALSPDCPGDSPTQGVG